MRRHVRDLALARDQRDDAGDLLRLDERLQRLIGQDPVGLGGGGDQPAATISFGMLLNLVAVANSEDPGVLWGFIRRYAPGVSPERDRGVWYRTSG